MIKDTILEVLARYADKQANLDSDILQNMIADEIEYDILNQIKKFDGSAHAK